MKSSLGDSDSILIKRESSSWTSRHRVDLKSSYCRTYSSRSNMAMTIDVGNLDIAPERTSSLQQYILNFEKKASFRDERLQIGNDIP